jgi:hypothetical protein
MAGDVGVEPTTFGSGDRRHALPKSSIDSYKVLSFSMIIESYMLRSDMVCYRIISPLGTYIGT